MKLNVAIVLFVLYAVCVVEETRGARILALVPTPSYSHQIPYRKLWIELNKRGHDIVLLTANPIPNINSSNFIQIDSNDNYSDLEGTNFLQLRFDGVSWIEWSEEKLFDMSNNFVENTLNNTKMRELYAPHNNVKFDVVMAEFLYMPGLYAFAYRFDAPLIGLSSLPLITLNEYALGGFVLPSHEYTWETEGNTEGNTESNLPFWKRLWNYVTLWKNIYLIYHNLISCQQQMVEHYFNMSVPPLVDIMKNTSLVFINQPEALTAARPTLPNMISFSSFHVNENPPPLSKDLQRFLDEAKQGFIYFSLGTNARSSTIPLEVQQIFFDVFRKLPYRIVWKYEKDIPVKLDNVYTSNWFPQQSILAHPNIKLFIYQGGLQSTEEAIQFAVPIVGFPILADQDYHISRMDALGVGKRLEIRTITREKLDSTIKEVITDKKYKEKIIQLRNIIRDKPYDATENLIWWTEYVIRHKGAPHLRSTLVDQPWYQRYDIDVVMFLTIVAFVIVSKSVNIIARLIVHLYKQMLIPVSQKQKLN